MHVMKNCKKSLTYYQNVLGLHWGFVGASFGLILNYSHYDTYSEATTSPNNSNERWNSSTDMHVCAHNILALFYKPMQHTSNLPTCFHF